MPLRLMSIMPGRAEEIFDWLMGEHLRNSQLYYVPHADYMLATAPMKDELSGTDMGKFVYTFKIEGN